MKRNILKETKEKGIEELQKMLVEYRWELDKIKITQKGGKLKNVMLSIKKRKEIAQILTILREKELSK